MSTPSSNPNKQRMQAIFAELAQGNGQPFVDAMADNFCWILPGQTAWSRRYEGKQVVHEQSVRRCAASGCPAETRRWWACGAFWRSGAPASSPGTVSRV
ncbi:MAG: hypothetical protein Q8K29_07680 [Polaromonas sp.]|nr:hypothetical protein [Polaromonas sp.]